MKLLTKQILNQFKKYPLYSQDGKGKQSNIIVKFFNPYGAGTWLITEGDVSDPDNIILYGYAKIWDNWEWGYVSYNELSNIRINVCGYQFPLERDSHLSANTTIEQYLKEE